MRLESVARTTETDDGLRDVRARAWMLRWLTAEGMTIANDLHLPLGSREDALVRLALTRLIQQATRAQTPNLCQQLMEAMTTDRPEPMRTAARCHCGGLLWNTLERNVGLCATCLSQEGQHLLRLPASASIEFARRWHEAKGIATVSGEDAFAEQAGHLLAALLKFKARRSA